MSDFAPRLNKTPADRATPGPEARNLPLGANDFRERIELPSPLVPRAGLARYSFKPAIPPSSDPVADTSAASEPTTGGGSRNTPYRPPVAARADAEAGETIAAPDRLEMTRPPHTGRYRAAGPPRPPSGSSPLPIQLKRSSAGDKVPDDLEVTWDGDPFTISFDRVEEQGSDVFKVFITYKGRFPVEGPLLKGKTTTLRVDIGPRPLDVTLTQIDAGVSLDLYGDGTKKLAVVDRFASEAQRGRRHDLALKQLGEARDTISVRVLDNSAKADPKSDAAVQGDVPGEATSGTLGADATWAMRIDGDGDQHKELLVTVSAVQTWPDAQYKGAPKQLRVVVKQLSSGKEVATSFDLPKPATGSSLFPIVTDVTDGKLPTVIDLELPQKAVLLEVRPPTAAGAEIEYQLSTAGQAHAVKFPVERGGRHPVAGADAPRVVGGISSIDVTLGAYGDRFRLTLQPQANNKATLGLSVLYGGEPDGGMGTTVELTSPPRLSVVKQGGITLELDLDGDGRTDLEIFDRLTAPQDSQGAGNPERDRNHQIRLVGAVIGGGQTTFNTSVRNGYPVGGYATPRAIDMEAASNAQAVSSLPKQTATYAADLDRIEIGLQSVRAAAAKSSIISAATYDAWLTLAQAMIRLRAEQSIKVMPATQSAAISAGDKFYQALAQETQAAVQYSGSRFRFSAVNDYTGMAESDVVGAGNRTTSYGAKLEQSLKAGNWADATTYYNRLVNGLDRWIADQLARNPTRAGETRSARYLGAAKKALGVIESNNPTRIQAVFHPEQEFMSSGRITEMPLSLYYWRDGSTWHLADLTNPLNTFDDTIAASPSETAPPSALFLKLDARIHFPKGIIHYQIPHGEAGNFRTTAPTSWTDYLAYIGLGAAVVGLTLVTFGTGTVVVAGSWILAASGVISAAGTTAEMVEKWRHGNLDATTAVISLAQIVASLAGSAALSSARIVTLAGGAIKAGAPWAGNWARLAVMADRVFVPLAGTKIAADVVTGVALTVEVARQLDTIEQSNATRDAKDRGKLLLLSQAVLSLGMLSLSVKGELGNMKAGRQLILYQPPDIDGVAKPPVALIGETVAPTTLKYSQKDIGALTEEGQSIDDLTKSMKTGGWKGRPLEVVELLDGSKVSIDNRRLVAANRAGLKQVPIAVHDAKDKLPIDQAERFILKEAAIRRLDTGELVTGGNKGTVLYPKGSVPTTYEEAALFRTANQGKLAGSKDKFPLMGRHDEPLIRAPKPAGPPKSSPPGEVE